MSLRDWSALGAVGCGSVQSPSLVAGPTDDAQAVRLQKPEIEKVRYSLLDTKNRTRSPSLRKPTLPPASGPPSTACRFWHEEVRDAAFLCCSI